MLRQGLQRFAAGAAASRGVARAPPHHLPGLLQVVCQCQGGVVGKIKTFADDTAADPYVDVAAARERAQMKAASLKAAAAKDQAAMDVFDRDVKRAQRDR